MYCKQTNVKGVCSWYKIWSLKSLAMLKCDSRNKTLSNGDDLDNNN